ncbi:MAG: ATP-binding protein [Bacteroidota bacterium]
MKTIKHQGLLYLIVLTVIATISIQVYWNVENYKANERQLIAEVQNSLDNSVENYYADLAKTDFFAFMGRDTLRRRRSESRISIFGKDSVVNIEMSPKKSRDALAFLLEGTDSANIHITPRNPPRPPRRMRLFGEKIRDSSSSIRLLLNRLITSATNENPDIPKIDSLFGQEMRRKEIGLAYRLQYFEDDTLKTSLAHGEAKAYALHTRSNSTYLLNFQKLELHYSNPVLTILKKSLLGILLSLLLSGCIVFSLFYLLHIIKKQKQLSEIKNDLISNITHEFKTPIATVSAALEGIQSFNAVNDREKTDKYVELSSAQLTKLHSMVEKLLETATLAGERLKLNKEPKDLVALLTNQVKKFKMVSTKEWLFQSNTKQLIRDIDPFHFENAITNLLDNAQKYGGDKIAVHLNSHGDQVEITVADNGGGIEKSQRDRIFDQFYRIPTGNRHDVKGFGIGLYHAKKIIEQHSGSLVLVPSREQSIFKITL